MSSSLMLSSVGKGLEEREKKKKKNTNKHKKDE